MFLNISKEKKFLFFIFIFAFLLRALFFVFYLGKNENYLVADFAYDTTAEQIYHGNGISNNQGEPQFNRLPVYPIFLGLMYKVFDGNKRATMWVQLFLSSFIPLLVFFLSLILLPGSLLTAKIATVISCIHLGFIFFSGVILTESLFTLFFLLFLILFLQQITYFCCKNKIKNFSYKKLFLSSLFVGIASLIRPIGQYLIFLIIVMIFLSSGYLINKIKRSITVFFGWILIVGGWLLRNYLFTGFLFFTTLPGVHFYFFSTNYVLSQSKNISSLQAKDCLDRESRNLFKKEEMVKQRELSEIEKCLLYKNLTLKHLKNHPIFFAKHCVINWCKTIFFPFFNELFYTKELKDGVWCKPAKDFLGFIKKFFLPRGKSLWLICVMYFDLILFLFLLIGSFGFIVKYIFIKDYFCLFIKSLPFIALFIFLTLACGYPRLRLPIEAFSIIFASHFYIKLLVRS